MLNGKNRRCMEIMCHFSYHLHFSFCLILLLGVYSYTHVLVDPSSHECKFELLISFRDLKVPAQIVNLLPHLTNGWQTYVLIYVDSFVELMKLFLLLASIYNEFHSSLIVVHGDLKKQYHFSLL